MIDVFFISGTMCTKDLWQYILPYLKNINPIHIDITSASSFDEINNILNNFWRFLYKILFKSSASKIKSQ